MCLSPDHATGNEDQGGGTGEPGIDDFDDFLAVAHFDDFNDSSDNTESDLLKQKNNELYELQAKMLSVPRSERKKLKLCAEELDVEIKTLSANFILFSEVQKSAVGLRAGIAAEDPDSIAACIETLLKVPGTLQGMDNTVLMYLSSAAEGIVASMQAYPTHNGVIKCGCHALCNLLGGLSKLSNGEDIARSLATADTGGAITEGMGAHVDDRDVQFYGCRVLNLLALNMNSACMTELQDLAKDSVENCIATACFFASARVAVSKARRKHVKDEGITQWADCAMRLL